MFVPSLRSRAGIWVQTLGAAATLLLVGAVQAQSQHQVIKPPKMQLWMDISTGGMTGMDELPGGIAATAAGAYGQARTLHLSPPRVVDVALWNSRKPGVEAAQLIPPGMRMGDSLLLVPVKPEVPAVHEPVEAASSEHQPPKGRLLVYWGCGANVREGQPVVVDLSQPGADRVQAFARVLGGRYVADRGAHVKPGYAVFPNGREQKFLPKDGSLVGEHRVTGESIAPSFKFRMGAEQDVMPAIELQSSGTLQDSIALSWASVTNARAYFLHAMATQGDDIVLWSSSESGESGMGLLDYLSNSAIDQWIKDRVLLAPQTTQCAIPKGILAGQGGNAFLRMMAYGGEQNFAYPPRPGDPKVAWEPEWAVRLRLKSHTVALLGQDAASRAAGANASAADNRKTPNGSPAPEPALPTINPINVLRGLLGR